MSRALLFLGVLSFITAGSASAQDRAVESDGSANQVTLIAYGHDPNCPGCRTFLAGYSHGGDCSCGQAPSCSCGHGPSCGCGGGGGDGKGGGGYGYGGDGLDADSGIPIGDDMLAADFGAGFGYDTAAPSMIGDFFGSLYQMQIGSAGQTSGFTNVPVSGADRRFKIAENYSPFPVDRVFFNYNHFHNALRTADGRQANLNRGTVGVEKTFFDQMWSAEFRLPFSSGLNNDQVVSGTADNVSGEVGNLAIVLKALLMSRDTYSVAAGLGMVLPTGPDGHLYDASNAEIMRMGNEAFYLQPFIGLWWTPTDRFFAQFAFQADFDTTGNEIDFLGTGTGPDGRIHDQTLLFLDASFGYWLFHDPYSDRLITGIAPMIELHHNTTAEDSEVFDRSSVDTTPVGFDVIMNPHNRMDVLNLTGAIRAELAGRSYLTVFGVAPLRGGEEKIFDAEFGVQYTRFY